MPDTQPTVRDAVEARFSLPFEPDLPEWVMWMPGGMHTVTATKRGKPYTLTLKVDSGTAATVQQSLRDHVAAGRQRPWFDFNHKGDEASAWPLEFAWKDRPEPGVYARVEYTSAGREAIAGRMYRAFSPKFYDSPTSPSEVDGAPLNMGGFTNDPAFDVISPVWCRKHNLTESMNEQATPAEATSAAADPTPKPNPNPQNTPNDGAVDAMRQELTTLRASIEARNGQDAEEIVDAHVDRGAIAPQDIETRNRWVGLIKADRGNVKLLARMPGREAVAAGRFAHHAAVTIGKMGVREALKAYVQASAPRDKGQIYRDEIHPILAAGDRIDFSRAPVEATNTLGTLVGDIISQRTLSLVVSRRPLLRGVVTDFSDERARKLQTVYTRTIGLPTVADFGSSASNTADTDYPVQLAYHKEVRFDFTAAEYLGTNRDLVKEHSEANSAAIGNYLVDTVAGLITTAFTSVTTGAAGSKDFTAISGAAKTLNTNKAPEIGRSFWVNSDFSEALGNDEFVMNYAKPDNSAAYGHWQNIRGFTDIWEYPELPANSINLIGFAFQQNALLIASRVADDPQTIIGAGYPGALQVITDPISGLSVLSDRWITAGTRAVSMRLDILFGCARGVVTSGVRYCTS